MDPAFVSTLATAASVGVAGVSVATLAATGSARVRAYRDAKLKAEAHAAASATELMKVEQERDVARILLNAGLRNARKDGGSGSSAEVGSSTVVGIIDSEAVEDLRIFREEMSPPMAGPVAREVDSTDDSERTAGRGRDVKGWVAAVGVIVAPIISAVSVYMFTRPAEVPDCASQIQSVVQVVSANPKAWVPISEDNVAAQECHLNQVAAQMLKK